MRLFHFKSPDGLLHFIVVHTSEDEARTSIKIAHGNYDLLLVGESRATKGSGIRLDVNMPIIEWERASQ